MATRDESEEREALIESIQKSVPAVKQRLEESGLRPGADPTQRNEDFLDTANRWSSDIWTGISWSLGFPADALFAVGQAVGADVPAPGSSARAFQTIFHWGKLAPAPGEEATDAYSLGRQFIGSSLVPAGFQMARGTTLLARPGGTSPAQIERARGNISEGRMLWRKGVEQGQKLTARNPVTVAATETVGGFAASHASKEADLIDPDNLALRAMFELSAGIASGSAVLAGVAGAKRGGGAVATRVIRSVPFVSGGKTVRSKAAVQERMGSMTEKEYKEVADNVARLSKEGVSPARATGSPGAISIEEAGRRIDPALDVRMAKMEANLNSKVERELLRYEAESVDDTAAWFDGLLLAAHQEASQALGAVAPRASGRTGQRPTQQLGSLSARMREILDKALRVARVRETTEWAKIKDTARVDLNNVLGRWQKAIVDHQITQEIGDLPPHLRKMLGTIDERGNFVRGELAKQSNMKLARTLRGWVLNEARNERASPTRSANKIRILNDIERALLDDMSASPDVAASMAYNRARKTSSELNKRFTQGAAGEILEYEPEGGLRFRPEETLDVILEGGGQRSVVRVRDAIKASPLLRAQISESLRVGFYIQAVDEKTGLLIPSAADVFIKNNRAVMEEFFPELIDSLTNAASRQRLVDEMAGSPIATSISAVQRNRSALSLYLNAPGGERIRSVMQNSVDPASAMADLVRKASQDPSGRALKGLRYEFMHTLTEAAKTPVDDQRGWRLSGKALEDLLKKHDRVARVVLADNPKALGVGPAGRLDAVPTMAPGARKRLDKFVEILKTQDPVKQTPIGDVIEDRPAWMLNLIARWLGARAGSRLGEGTIGTPLVLAGFMSREMQNRLLHLTRDRAREIVFEAIEDPVVWNALLTPIGPNTPRQKIELVTQQLLPLLSGTVARTASRTTDPTPFEREERARSPLSDNEDLMRQIMELQTVVNRELGNRKQ